MKMTTSRIIMGAVAVLAIVGAGLSFHCYYGLTASELQSTVSAYVEKGSLNEARQYLSSVEGSVGRSRRPLVRAEYLYERALVEFLAMRKSEQFPDPVKAVQYFQVLRGHMAESKTIIEQNKLSGQEPAFLAARIQEALNDMAEFEREKLFAANREAMLVRQAQSMGQGGVSGAAFNITRPRKTK